MFHTIIAAIDGSPHSLQALNYAKSLAGRYTATLILVHAYPYTSDLHDVAGYQKLLVQRKSAGEKILLLAEELLGRHEFEIQEALIEGPAAEAILSVAQSRAADLIVMGSRGMGTVKGLLFGSVATKVSHQASCPVLVAPWPRGDGLTRTPATT